jgi:hypothetical protein
MSILSSFFFIYSPPKRIGKAGGLNKNRIASKAWLPENSSVSMTEARALFRSYCIRMGKQGWLRRMLASSRSEILLENFPKTVFL